MDLLPTLLTIELSPRNFNFRINNSWNILLKGRRVMVSVFLSREFLSYFYSQKLVMRSADDISMTKSENLQQDEFFFIFFINN